MTKEIRQNIANPTHILVSDGTSAGSNIGHTPIADGLQLPATIDSIVRIRSGNSAALDALVLQNNELAYDSERNTPPPGDGSTLGIA